ncbi:MAG: Gfo/Idh/MocA family oxidoreductase [Planctomycetota bacterium]
MSTGSDPLRVGIVGCGAISHAYQKGCELYEELEIVHVADLDVERAKEIGEMWGVAKAGSVEGLLADPEVEAVVNLTIPAAHASVSEQALRAGKHVYLEKPLATSVEEALPVLALAEEAGLRVSCAPDTFLGVSHQTARRAIDDGKIGRPTSATMFMQGRGHEHWHPAPEFYYKPGGGPLYDMGPYYLTDLVQLLGPIKRVSAMAGRAFDQRTITSQPLNGTVIDVEVDTHVAATLETVSGAIVTLITSFDVALHSLPNIQVHGTEGSMQVPDPNGFGGEVRVCAWGSEEWEDLPAIAPAEGQRGAGLADLARAIREDQPHLVSAELALHVLEAMEAISESSQTGRAVELRYVCERPGPLEPLSV